MPIISLCYSYYAHKNDFVSSNVKIMSDCQLLQKNKIKLVTEGLKISIINMAESVDAGEQTFDERKKEIKEIRGIYGIDLIISLPQAKYSH